MRVAALYDLHGNLPALEAVLAEADAAGADLIVFGGDLAWGPLPRETMDRVMEIEGRALFVRGNADREVGLRYGIEEGLEATTAAVNVWTADQLTEHHRGFLRSLPDTAVVDVDELGPVLFCHGSPRSDEETITAATPDGRVAEMLAGVDQPTVLCGHTHAQFDRTVGEHRVVNAGSVGLPFGEAGAYWAMLGPGVSLRRTDYDYETTAAMIRAKNGPEAGSFAQHILSPPQVGTAAELWG